MAYLRPQKHLRWLIFVCQTGTFSENLGKKGLLGNVWVSARDVCWYDKVLMIRLDCLQSWTPIFNQATTFDRQYLLHILSIIVFQLQKPFTPNPSKHFFPCEIVSFSNNSDGLENICYVIEATGLRFEYLLILNLIQLDKMIALFDFTDKMLQKSQT